MRYYIRNLLLNPCFRLVVDMGNKDKQTVYVIGHINPDTDSICSAIAYAELKKKITGDDYKPRRAGQLNLETRFVLDYFGVTCTDSDCILHQDCSTGSGCSCGKTWCLSGNLECRTSLQSAFH